MAPPSRAAASASRSAVAADIPLGQVLPRIFETDAGLAWYLGRVVGYGTAAGGCATVLVSYEDGDSEELTHREALGASFSSLLFFPTDTRGTLAQRRSTGHAPSAPRLTRCARAALSGALKDLIAENHLRPAAEIVQPAAAAEASPSDAAAAPSSAAAGAFAPAAEATSPAAGAAGEESPTAEDVGPSAEPAAAGALAQPTAPSRAIHTHPQPQPQPQPRASAIPTAATAAPSQAATAAHPASTPASASTPAAFPPLWRRGGRATLRALLACGLLPSRRVVALRGEERHSAWVRLDGSLEYPVGTQVGTKVGTSSDAHGVARAPHVTAFVNAALSMSCVDGWPHAFLCACPPAASAVPCEGCTDPTPLTDVRRLLKGALAASTAAAAAAVALSAAEATDAADSSCGDSSSDDSDDDDEGAAAGAAAPREAAPRYSTRRSAPIPPQFLAAVRAARDADSRSLFAVPVRVAYRHDHALLARYARIVRNPMDFSTVSCALACSSVSMRLRQAIF